MQRPILLLTTIATLAFAGCITPAAKNVQPASSSSDAMAGMSDLHTAKWQGHITTPAFTVLSHGQPTEDVAYNVQQEGFMFDIMEQPKALEIRLDWKGAPDAVFWINPHFMTGHTNGTVNAPPAYSQASTNFLNFHTNASSQNPQCLRIPANDLHPGMWETMIHMAPQKTGPGMGLVAPGDFTLTIGVVGAMADIKKDERHGHKDNAVFDEQPSEECQMLVGAAST